MLKKPPPNKQQERQQSEKERIDKDRNYFVNKSASILLKELEGFTIDGERNKSENSKKSNKKISDTKGNLISLFDEKGRG